MAANGEESSMMGVLLCAWDANIQASSTQICVRRGIGGVDVTFVQPLNQVSQRQVEAARHVRDIQVRRKMSMAK